MSSERCVVVTAGASGIGLAIARAFATDGARVHICDVDEDALRAVSDTGPSITGTVCDVSDRAAVERFVQDAVDTLGGIEYS